MQGEKPYTGRMDHAFLLHFTNLKLNSASFPNARADWYIPDGS
jgi:hypothetical protein